MIGRGTEKLVLDTIIVEHLPDEPVATIVLNRPDKRNALSSELLGELGAVIDWLNATTAIKVIIVRGAGRGFSAGFNFDEFVDTDATMPTLRDIGDVGRVVVDALSGVRPVTIAAIHGPCVGGGILVAAACDLRLAAASTTFRIPAIDLGLPLVWGGVPRLTRELGPAATKDLLLTGRPFDAHEARRIGFVNRVLPDDDALFAAAQALADELAAKPAFGLVATKRHVNAVMDEIAGIGRSHNDADTFAVGLNDPESVAAIDAYLGRNDG